jgi:signal transduction histidine kinase
MGFFKIKDRGKAALTTYISMLAVLDHGGVFETVIPNSSDRKSSDKEYIVELAPSFVVARYWIKPQFERFAEPLAQLLSELIMEQLETSWISTILETTNAPISLEQSQEGYFADIAMQVANGSVARIVTVRLFDQQDGKIEREKLSCWAVCDALPGRSREQWPNRKSFHIHNGRSDAFSYYDGFVEDFLRTGKSVFILPNTSHHGLFAIGRKYFDDVNINTIIVVCLSVGGDILGFLTMIYEGSVNLTEPLQSAFANMANHTAVAIANYQKVKEISRLQEQRLRDFTSSLQLELLQGFRHTARTYLHLAVSYARRLNAFVQYRGDPKENPSPRLEEALEGIDGALVNIESLRFIGDQMESADIGEIFDEAVKLMEMRLAREGIEAKRTPGRFVLALNRDAMKSAFANLLLNSVEAFRDSNARKGGRQISLNIARSGTDFQLDYSDNGPGIRLGHAGIKQLTDIWEPGKTSKKHGTGYGLTMVRQVFQQLQGGSINLRESSKNGIVFRIRLPMTRK